MKNSFVYNLWSWSKVPMDMGPRSLASFFDWLGSNRGQVMFFVSLPLPLGWAFGWPVYISYILWEAVLAFPFFIYILSFLSKKKRINWFIVWEENFLIGTMVFIFINRKNIWDNNKVILIGEMEYIEVGILLDFSVGEWFEYL